MNSETQKVLVKLNQSIIKIRGAYALWSKDNNITYPEMLVFYSLRKGGNCSQKTICENYLLPKQTINNTIKSLLGRKLVQFNKISSQEKILSLTIEGKEYSNNLMSSLEKIENTAVKEIGQKNLISMIQTALLYGDLLIQMISTSK